MAKKSTLFSLLKQVLLVVAFVALGNTSYAQVGIGTDYPDPASQLDVVASNRGVLIPRIKLTSTLDDTTISAGNQESLLVYNTSSVKDVYPGYYYWAQDHWARLINDSDLGDTNTTNQQLLAQNSALILRDNQDGSVQVALRDLQILTNLRDNGDGTISFFNEYGEEQIMDIASMVSGDQTLTYLTENTDGSLSYTDEHNQTHRIPLPDLIKEYEDLTSITVNVDNGTLTYFDENGDQTDIDITEFIEHHETLTSIVQNANGSWSYFDENADETIFALPELISQYEDVTYIITDLQDGTIVYVDEDGESTTINIKEFVNQHETVSTLVDNQDGTFAYTDEKGTVTMIPLSELIASHEEITELNYDVAEGTITYLDEAGSENSIDIQVFVKTFETITTFVENADGTFTHTNEAGISTLVDVSDFETLTLLALNSAGTILTYTDEDGTETDLNLKELVDNLETVTSLVEGTEEGTLVYTNEEGTSNTLNVADLQTLTSIALNPDDSHIDYLDEDGNTASLDLTALVQNLESVTTLVESANGTFTYLNEAGEESVINIKNLETLTSLLWNEEETALIYTDEDGGVTQLNFQELLDTFETVTSLVEGTEGGTLVYTNEEGASNILSVRGLQTLTSIALNPDDSHIDYLDEDGNTTSLDLTALVQNLESVTTLVESANGTFTYLNEAGEESVVNIKNLETLTSLLWNEDGTVLIYTDEDGEEYELDISDLLSEIVADNGLILTENETETTVGLGGELNRKTEITTTADNTLAVTGLQSGQTSNIAPVPNSRNMVRPDQLMVMDSQGVLKSAISAMPKFFYMPSVLIDIYGSNRILDLHATYVEQFGSPLVASANAPAAIPHLPQATDFYYYVTYYDDSVFENVEISNVGLLRYTLKSNATMSQHSFMNIVLVIKD